VKRLVLLIPGNPGDAAYYTAFVALLRARGHEVLVSGHPTPGSATPPPDLLPLARHHAEAAARHLDARGRAAGDVEVVVIGHSLGAYLAYLVVAHGLLPVARVLMLFPFLMRPAFSGRLILRAVGRRRLFGAVLALFRALPQRLQAWLLRVGGVGDLVPAVLAALASEAAPAAAALARTEEIEIAGRGDAAYLFDHPLFAARERFAALFAPGDRWAPAALARQLAAFAYHFPPPVSHAFVVDARQREAVADVVHRLIAGDDPRG
jgi:pimeloyl-ACP methyl ester carboxylesterase